MRNAYDVAETETIRLTLPKPLADDARLAARGSGRTLAQMIEATLTEGLAAPTRNRSGR
jgi:hypothetical protein